VSSIAPCLHVPSQGLGLVNDRTLDLHVDQGEQQQHDQARHHDGKARADRLRQAAVVIVHGRPPSYPSGGGKPRRRSSMNSSTVPIADATSIM
jgi:hypothetical protein